MISRSSWHNNNVDYRVDDYSATFATAPYLEVLADDTVSNEGIIERTDVDAFRFTTSGGNVSLTASTVSDGPNIDILAEIYKSANTLMASNNPTPHSARLSPLLWLRALHT
jgi:hypothetical protein